MKEVVSQSPNDHAGGRAGRPVSAVSPREDILGVRPIDDEVLQAFPGTLNCTRETFSEATSKETGPVSFTRTYYIVHVLLGVFVNVLKYERRSSEAIPEVMNWNASST